MDTYRKKADGIYNGKAFAHKMANTYRKYETILTQRMAHTHTHTDPVTVEYNQINTVYTHGEEQPKKKACFIGIRLTRRMDRLFTLQAF